MRMFYADLGFQFEEYVSAALSTVKFPRKGR